MATLRPEDNRLYERADALHPLHWERLRRRDPQEAARAAGARWDGRRYLLPLLGRALWVDPVRAALGCCDEPERPVSYQRGLVAVAYLAGALEVPAQGTWVAFRELPGGEAFFRGPHSLDTPRLARRFGAAPAELAAAARSLGGAEDRGADAAATVPALPRIPLQALVWGETPEFPPSAVLLVDGRAHLHLALDVLWALSNVAIAALVRGRP
ncbi:MAG: hypothetical protein Kow0092_08650 [Deferrisomatales bacterium]